MSESFAREISGVFYIDGKLWHITPDQAYSDLARDMVWRAEDGYGLGNDFAFQAVKEALDYIVDNGLGDEDIITNFADSETDVYTGKLVEWLASAPGSHLEFCDEALREFGTPESTWKLLQFGQYCAYKAAMQAVLDLWPEPVVDDDVESDGDGVPG